MALAVAALIAHAELALADPSATDRARAEALFREAQVAYEAERYPEAIRGYQAAYDVVPIPAFLFNIAQAHRLSGEPRAALAMYRRFLAIAPEHVLSADARRFAAQLEQSLPPEPVAPPVVTLAPAPVTARPDAHEPATLPPLDGHPGRPLRVMGLVAGGVGIGLLGLGVKFGLDAKRHQNALEDYDRDAWTDTALARQKQGERAEKNMLLSTVAASGALVTGGVLYWLGWQRGHAAEAVRIEPVLTDRGAQITARFLF
jgi:tetratricopeptide (TPR) repeat protein